MSGYMLKMSTNEISLITFYDPPSSLGSHRPHRSHPSHTLLDSIQKDSQKSCDIKLYVIMDSLAESSMTETPNSCLNTSKNFLQFLVPNLKKIPPQPIIPKQMDKQNTWIKSSNNIFTFSSRWLERMVVYGRICLQQLCEYMPLMCGDTDEHQNKKGVCLREWEPERVPEEHQQTTNIKESKESVMCIDTSKNLKGSVSTKGENLKGSQNNTTTTKHQYKENTKLNGRMYT
jgi:hypothetical protein